MRTVCERLAYRYPLTLVGGGVLLYAVGPNIIASSSLTGPEFLLLRLLLGLPILAAVVLLTRRRQPAFREAPRARFEVSWLWSLLAGLAFALHQLSFMTAVKRTSVADTALLDTLSPVIVMLLAIPMFGERPTKQFVGWSCLAMTGAGMIVLAGASGPSGDPVGMLMAGASVVFFALFFLFSKAARPSSHVWSFLLVVSVIATLVIALYFLGTAAPLPRPPARDIQLALALALGPGTLGHYLMTWPLALLPANVPPVLRLLTPFLASGIAWAVLSQPMQGLHVLGGAITASGVLGTVLTHRRERQPTGGEPGAAPPPPP